MAGYILRWFVAYLSTDGLSPIQVLSYYTNPAVHL